MTRRVYWAKYVAAASETEEQLKMRSIIRMKYRSNLNAIWATASPVIAGSAISSLFRHWKGDRAASPPAYVDAKVDWREKRLA
ncbi:hypothetical protein KCP69_18180 [Salmonella enterica subsp. enterica]|nr:hypothetical protein KCP69_18180 [Salmonella enterica subsp. enterica]